MRVFLKPVKTHFISGKPALRDFFDEKGVLLLSKGQMIPRPLAKALNSRNVYSLRYEWCDPSEETLCDSSDGPSTCPKTNIVSDRVCPWIHPILSKANLIEPSLLSSGVLFIDQLVRDFEVHPGLAADFKALQSYDNYTYSHSINVALLTFAIAKIINYQGEKLKRLVLGALLHDIGKLTIPISIIDKPSTLSDEEMHVVQTHPTRGFQRSSDFFLPRSVLAVILEHHERWNGLGYPKGLSKGAIHPYAQIVAVADVFDALIGDRPYRLALPPYHALEMIIKQAGTDFSPEVIDAFLRAVQIYPKNSLVTLNSGESGIVIDYSRPYPTRPVVKLLFDADGRMLEKERVIDLIQDSHHYVQTVMYNWAK